MAQSVKQLTNLVSVRVVHSKNPLMASEKTTQKYLTGRCSAHRFLAKYGYLNQAAHVAINGMPQTNVGLKDHRLAHGDVVEVAVVAQDPASLTVFFIQLGASAAVAATLTTVFVSVAINLALQALISVISGGAGSSNSGSQRTAETSASAFGLSAGSNSFRQNQGLPVVMGKHRIFPDYAGRFWLDYIQDLSSGRRINNGTPEYRSTRSRNLNFGPFPGEKPWDQFTPEEQRPFGLRLLSGTWTAGESLIYADTADGGYPDPARTYVNGYGETVTMPHTFVFRYTLPPFPGQPWYSPAATIEWCTYEEYIDPPVNGADDLGNPTFGNRFRAGQPPDVVDIIVGYGYESFENTQRLNAIFNYGLGHLQLDKHFIGTTPVDDFTAVSLSPTIYNSLGTGMGGWHYASEPDTENRPFPTDVETEINAGGLSKKPGEVGVWITRQTKRRSANYLEIDISGQLFYNGNTGPETRSAVFTIEYAVVDSEAWTAAPFSPLTLSNGDLTAVRETRGWAVTPAHYKVRVRLDSDDSTDARLKQEFLFEAHKAYNTDYTAYAAQKRLGVQIKASKQLSGALDRWSSLATAFTWVYQGGADWDGSVPGQSDQWLLLPTTNPAWWFLNFCMGAFLNSYFDDGWCLGEHPANRQKLYGLGRRHARIDYTSIVRWAAWCAATDLQFGHVMDQSMNCYDALSLIARVGRAQLSQPRGRIGVIYFTASDPVLQVFGMDNIVAGSFSISYVNEVTPDRIVVNFANADADYAAEQVEAVVPGVAVPIREQQITIPGITSKPQAQREANLIAAEQFYHRRTITWRTDIEGLICSRGDVVALAHDMTQWAASARVVRFVVKSGFIAAFELNRELHDPSAASEYFVSLRQPNGQLPIYRAVPPSQPTNTLSLVQPIPMAEVSGILDAAGTFNPASAWPDTQPEDFMVMAGVQSRPGKRVRILSVAPSSDKKVEITAVDHVPAYYASEYTLDQGTFTSEERLVAVASNTAIEQRANGQLALVWRLQNALGAIVSVSVNAGPTSVLASNDQQPGESLILPSFQVGTRLQFTVTPEPIAQATSILSDYLAITI